MYRFVAVIERAPSGNYAGYFPALPGTGATAPTRDEVVAALRGILVMHLHAMERDGDELPASDEGAEVLEVSEDEVHTFTSDPLPSSSATL